MWNRLSCPAVLCALSAVTSFGQSSTPAVTDRERALLERIARLEERLSMVEGKVGVVAPAPEPTPPREQQSTPDAAANALSSSFAAPPQTAETSWLKDTTLNFQFDGYYLWNANRPVGRVNLLRAYDVTANNFSINQAGMVIEKTPNVDAGRRWGYRLDVMYGQATETLQGGAQNEPRPHVYRPVFQAYGTYVLPAGSGLTVDFGKWASALGFENNYTKDQMNYSRSYFFNFLPFYHMGFRTSYNVNDKLSTAYWLINGANQTEDFNGFKSQLVQAVVKPTKTSYWTLNYYVGQEQRDLVPALNPGIPSLPTQPGLSLTRVSPVPSGRFHVIDTYAQASPTEKLTLAGEFDYVVNRIESHGSPQRIVGGAAYLKYQLTPKVYFAQRYVRLNDKAGLFSGVSQNLNDVTSTLAFRPGDGFETRFEYRRDFSNVPFFLGRQLNETKKAQDTLTLGLIWWFGGKQGAW